MTVLSLAELLAAASPAIPVEHIRGMEGDEFLGWASDFPEETAAHALRLLAGCEGLKQTSGGATTGRASSRSSSANTLRTGAP